MAENGLDLRTWLTVIGVFMLFFGFPAATIAFDVRKKRRQEARELAATDPLPARVPARPTASTRPYAKDASRRSATTEVQVDTSRPPQTSIASSRRERNESAPTQCT